MANDGLRELYRTNFAVFAQRYIRVVAPGLVLEWNWHHDLICYWLEQLARGEIERLLICVPPRSLKSLLCSVLYPAWLLGLNPSEAVLCVSYAQPLAETFARQSRQVMESDAYKATFSTRVSREKRAADHFETTKGGLRIATSVGGTVTGRGGDTIILDDLMKPDEAASESGRRATIEWLRSTLPSRSNSQLKVRVLCVMQRLNCRDVASEFIEQGGWNVLALPAIAVEPEEHHFETLLGPQVVSRQPGDLLHPERLPRHVLERIQKQMGSMLYEAQYQQQPVPEEGNLFRRAWVQSYAPAEGHGFDQVIQSWDTAGKTGQHNDFSVCVTLGLKGSRAYLLDVHREKLEFPALRTRVIDLAVRWRAERVLIEDQSSGIALIQELKAVGFYKAFAIKPKGDKVQRLLGVTPMFENGQVLLPLSAPWLDAYLHELCAFPLGRNDDQVDATTQALAWLREFGAEPAIITFYREEAERERASREDNTVRMRAPEGSNRWGMKDGTWVTIPPDGIVMVTPENAPSLRLAGWVDVPHG